VNIKLSKAIYFDAYNDNKSNGAFIDATTNTTAGEIYSPPPEASILRGSWEPIMLVLSF
jgi:sulfate adenylyltransferase subunit 1 (EFTu-like GTPase family)